MKQKALFNMGENLSPPLSGQIFKAMQDLVRHADDVYWITDHETVFERLSSLFLEAGGDNKQLVKEWPEMFTP